MIAWYIWLAFIAFIGICLAVDLGFLNRSGERGFRQALAWTGGWLLVGVAFGALLWVWKGGHAAEQYFAGYVVEWSLSVDNVFVFLLIMRQFEVPRPLQNRVLLLAIAGAIVLRLAFVLAGSALVHRFDWILYLFGAFLLATAIRFVFQGDRERPVAKSRVLRTLRRIVPMTDRYADGRFLVRSSGRLAATPLFAVLALIMVTDVMFAVDSIPAIFAITTNAFIVFTANALAVLGLRSLYTALAGAVQRFRYLKPSLAAVLAFVGLKMLGKDIAHIGAGPSLAVIVAILAVGITASWLRPARSGTTGANRDTV